MEPDGILNAWTMKLRMNSAISSAKKNASAYSRTADFSRTRSEGVRVARAAVLPLAMSCRLSAA